MALLRRAGKVALGTATAAAAAAAAASQTSCHLCRLSPFPVPPYQPSLRLRFTSASSSLSTSLLDSRPEDLLHSTLPSAMPPPFLQTSDIEDEPEEAAGHDGCPELQAVLGLVSRAKAQSLSKEEALGLLNDSGIEPSRDTVSSLIWELRGDWESAVLVFQWGEACISSCLRAWHLMISVLARSGKFEIAWLFVRQMHRLKVLTNRPFRILIERYAAANRLDKAMMTFHAMEKFKMTANSTMFYALLRALCKYKNVEEAEQLLLSNRKFYPLETEGFNIILDGWCNVMIDVVEAKRLWREMSNCCIVPDGTSYVSMICCFSKVGNLFDSVRLYDEMKRRGWIPDLSVYNALIYVLARENCVIEAKKLFNKIEDAGLRANVDTYNSIIFPLCEAHKLNEARVLLESMVTKGFHPTIETYHAFAKTEDLEGTFNLIKRMKCAGCGPNRYTFLLILEKFFNLDEAGNALRIWWEMKRDHMEPHVTHYVALIRGLASCGWFPKALEFYGEMKSKGLNDPNVEKLIKEITVRNKHRTLWGRAERYKGYHGRVS